MGVVQGRFGAQARRARKRRSSLCAQGHHQWEVVKNRPFDVKRGELVTLERCKRCGAERTRGT